VKEDNYIATSTHITQLFLLDCYVIVKARTSDPDDVLMFSSSHVICLKVYNDRLSLVAGEFEVYKISA